MAKATMATVKSFIRKNRGNILIYSKSRFDGMIDGVRNTGETGFTKAIETTDHVDNTLGIQGAWIVGSSRDLITPFEKDDIRGFEIYNCCGSFSIGIKC